jgi:hypothetical protein
MEDHTRQQREDHVRALNVVVSGGYGIHMFEINALSLSFDLLPCRFQNGADSVTKVYTVLNSSLGPLKRAVTLLKVWLDIIIKK